MEVYELDGRKRFMLLPALTEALSETIHYIKGLTGAAGPAHISSSRPTLQVSTTKVIAGEEQMAGVIVLEGDLGDKGQK